MSPEYQKINSIYKRDTKGRIIPGDWAMPEYEYLLHNAWQFTEKVDGTNIRLHFDRFEDQVFADIAGRTDNAQIPPHLLKVLQAEVKRMGDLVGPMMLEREITSMTLYGEGYGAKIQKGGGNYRPDAGFVLFDVKVGNWWLARENVEDVAVKVGVDVVPIVVQESLEFAIDLVRTGDWKSQWPGVADPEGLVGRPVVDLFNRRGERIITKIKAKDLR